MKRRLALHCPFQPQQTPSTNRGWSRSAAMSIHWLDPSSIKAWQTPPRASTACCSCSTPRPRSTRISTRSSPRSRTRRFVRSITSGSRQPNSVRASARRTQISRKSQPGSRRRDSLSTKSPPAAGSSPSPVQPHKSPQHSTRLCTSTVSTEPTTSPMRRTRRFPSACQA